MLSINDDDADNIINEAYKKHPNIVAVLHDYY
jgi:hypothetical protein